ncbi:MFS transporter [Virgibacillus necropolis]|uniref:MFS transporter n=1 Tax=Virgibacillus necropolis TaxID=163877 RepID=UPI00384B439B
MEKVVSADSDSKTPTYVIITSLLFWCALIVVSSVYIMTPLVGTLVSEFHVSQTMATWTSSIFSLFYGLGFLLFGPLSDRFGRKPIIVFGLCVLTVVTVFIGFTTEFYLLVILRGVQGLVSATFAPAALAYVFDVYPKERLVTTIGFISFGFLTAGIFGQVFAGVINQIFDWNTVFLFFGGMYFCTIIAVILILPSTKNHVTDVSVSNFLKQTMSIFTQKNFLLCYGITLMLLLTFIGMYTVFGDYLSGAIFNLSKKEILVVRAAGLIGMILSPFTGIFVKRYGLLLILKMGLALSVVGLLVLGFSHNLFIIVSMSVVYVAGISLTFPAIMTLIGELGGATRAIAASFYTFILFIGATVGPIVAITIMQTGSYVLTFGMLALLLSIGLAASFFIKY